MPSNQEPPQHVKDEFVLAAHGDLAKVKAMAATAPQLVFATAKWGETAIGAAAHTGHRDIVEFFLAHGVDVDICVAAMLGLTDRVAAILKEDAKRALTGGAHDISVLYHAALGGNQDIAELLVHHGADVNSGEAGSPPIHGAVRKGHTRMVEWLLGHGARVNALDFEKRTPLRRALDQQHGEIAELLQKHGGTA